MFHREDMQQRSNRSQKGLPLQGDNLCASPFIIPEEAKNGDSIRYIFLPNNIDIRSKRGIMTSLTITSIYLVKLCEVRSMSFEEVKEVFVDTLNCDADKVTMDASLTDDLQADSLDAVELNMAFEDKFGVTIADEDLGTLKTVGDIFNYLAARAA